MAQYTITITGCMPDISPPQVADTDTVTFCSTDRAYQITGLGNVFSGNPGIVRVPAPSGGANGCTGPLTVNGGNGHYPYNVGPNCSPQGAPEIIIDEGTKKGKPGY